MYSTYLTFDKTNLCASVRNVGKALDHEKALALLCVPGIESRVHIRVSFLSQRAVFLPVMI